MKNLFGLSFLAFSLAGCITATVNEPSACKTNTLTFTTDSDPASLPAGFDAGGVNLPPVSASTQIDLSNMFSKLTSNGTVNANIYQNTLTSLDGNFSWIEAINVTMVSVYDAVDYPSITLVNQTVNSSSNVLDLQTLASGDQIVQYLSQGPIQLTYTVTGTVPTNGPIVNAVDVTDNLCVSASLTVSKGL